MRRASKGGGILNLKRILALAVAVASLAGGGVALAAANGNSKSHAHKTGKPTTRATTPKNGVMPHNCPNMGQSNSNANAAFNM